MFVFVKAHLAKLAKEMVEKNRTDSAKAMTKRAEQREAELNTLIDTLEARHGWYFLLHYITQILL